MLSKCNVDPKNYTNQFTKSNQKTFGENLKKNNCNIVLPLLSC
jgi:hypothetical protein